MPTEKPSNPAIPKNYRQLKGSERRLPATATSLGPADASEVLSVTIVLRRRPDGPPVPSFDDFAKTPPSQRRRMAQDEFAAKYGAAPQDIDAVVGFARSHHLKIVETHAARRTVVVSGTAAQMSAAFAVALGRYRRTVPGHRKKPPRTEIFRGRDGFIHIPNDLADIVVGVFGLDNRGVSRPTGGPADPPYTTPIRVEQVTGLYQFPPLGSGIAGQTIGIIAPTGGFGGYLMTDIQAYFNAINMPNVAATFQPIPIAVDGVTNGTVFAATVGDAPAGQNTLTFAPGGPSAGLLPLSVGFYTVGGQSFLVQVVSVASTMASTIVTVETFDTTTQQFVTAGFAALVPNGTPAYFNLDQETTQDICIAASAAQGASVAVYFTTDTEGGWIDLINRAVHPDPNDFPAGVSPPSVLSASWIIAAGDDPGGIAYSDAHLGTAITVGGIQAMDTAFQDAALQGLTVCVSSGDNGSDCGVGDGFAHVYFPASDPWVLGVGGTTIGRQSSTSTVWEEYVWNDTFFGSETGATGGGVSDFFPLPSYQNGAGVPSSVNPGTSFNATGRGVPDVAANASPNSGYNLFVGGQSAVGDGTSASTPLWAALIAVLNSNLPDNVGFINPFLYALGSSGFNAINPLWPDPANPQLAACPPNNAIAGAPGYKAGPGWDACTGWGSPNGMALWTALKQGAAQALYVIVDQSTFSKAVVAAGDTSYASAFFVVVDGFTPGQLGITPATLTNPTVQPQFAPASPNGMTFMFDAVQPADATLLMSSPNAPQRFTYVYSITFTGTGGFPVPPAESTLVTTTATVKATVKGSLVTVSGTASFDLVDSPDPFFAGGSGVPWLSADLRVFQVEPGAEWISGNFNSGATLNNTGHPSVDATSFIQMLIRQLNLPGSQSFSNDVFEGIQTDETKSSLDTMPTDPANQNNPVYNFALARVRYNATTASAQSVRVFFRLIPALSTSVAYDQTTNYRRWSNGFEFGETIPLLGIDPTTGDVMTIPCFAVPRIDVTQASMTTQTDEPNVQTIAANGGAEVDAFFGCWLDLNQIETQYPANLSQLPAKVPLSKPDGPFPSASLQTIQTLVTNIHQCLVAEIAFDLDPIPAGQTPSTTGPLAQRNLTLLPVANPGVVGSRRGPSYFTVRPSAASAAGSQRPDELMIDWGNLPAGSVASIYWPAVGAATILQMAARLYATHSLTLSDDHTIETPVGGITYIPIPPGTAAGFDGLITVDLPLGITKGQVFTIVVRQVTGAGAAQATPASLKRPSWRRVLGAFQITIPVSIKAALLAPEERLLSMLKWTERTIPPTSRRFPVFRRYVEQIAERVRGLGGDPSLILASPDGSGAPTATAGAHAQPPGHGPRLQFTGKVTGLKYDRFGDFEGFSLRTEHGDERFFQGREREIEALVDRAWTGRMVITVIVLRHDPDWPESIMLRRAPRPAQH